MASVGLPTTESCAVMSDDLTHPRLSFEDVHFDQDTALELLNDAATLLREPDLTDEMRRGWLRRFEELGR